LFLQLAAGQAKVVGAGTMRALEIMNEPNGWWAGREHFSTPYEMAALLSAAYDGHQSSMGAGVGAKTADPAMLVIQGGLAGGPIVSTLTMMQLWAEHFRPDGLFPADVINYHFYCQTEDASAGAPPEACGLRELARNVSAWRDQHAPRLQVREATAPKQEEKEEEKKYKGCPTGSK
jgi:hypothetical protein